MLERAIAALVSTVVAGTILAGFLLAPATQGGNESDLPLQSHARIAIDGNQGFTTANGVVGGNGSPSDPFVIEGWNITIDDWYQSGVSVSNTSAYFVLRDVSVQAPGPAYESWAVKLTLTQNGTIDNVRGFGKGWEETFAGIFLDTSSAVTVSRCEFVPGSMGAGVLIRDSTNVTIAANFVQSISILHASNVTVSRNKVSVNIAIDSSDGIVLDENEVHHTSVYVSSNPSGLDFASILLTSSRNSTLRANLLTNAGIDIAGSSSEDYTTNTVTLDNLVNGKPVRFYKNCADVVVSGVLAGQVLVAECENVRIAGLNLSYTNVAVKLVRVHHATVENGTFMSNSPRAVEVDESDNVTFTGNRFLRNNNAFLFRNSQNVLVYHNDFLFDWGNIFNPWNIYDNRSDVRWDSGYPLGGNFWYYYEGADHCRGPAQDDCSAGDGLGDAPYDIPAWSFGPTVGTDRYPLTKPVTMVPAVPLPPLPATALVVLLAVLLLLGALGLRRRQKRTPIDPALPVRQESDLGVVGHSDHRTADENPPQEPPPS